MSSHEEKTLVGSGPRTLLPLLKQLVRFNLVGVLNTAVDFGLFFLLDRLGMPYLLAQTCSYGSGIVNSYIFNKYWTFGVTGIRTAELLRFATVNLASLIISILLVFLFHSLLQLPLLYAKIAATLLTMMISFSGNRLWVFKSESGPI